MYVVLSVSGEDLVVRYGEKVSASVVLLSEVSLSEVSLSEMSLSEMSLSEASEVEMVGMSFLRRKGNAVVGAECWEEVSVSGLLLLSLSGLLLEEATISFLRRKGSSRAGARFDGVKNL